MVIHYNLVHTMTVIGFVNKDPLMSQTHVMFFFKYRAEKSYNNAYTFYFPEFK